MYSRFALEWELVGGDPAPGEPNAYTMLSGFFDGTAQNAQEAACRLRALALNADDAVWRGEAADAFREDLGELPKKLDKLYRSYHEASEALRIYGVSLRQFQSRAQTELERAVAADEEMRRQVDAMLDSMATPGGPVAPAPVGVGPGPTGPAPFGPGLEATNGSGNPTGDPRSRLAAARAAVEQIRQDRVSEEGKCVAKLDHAHDVGMHNKGLLDKIGGWVGDRIGDLKDLEHKMLRAIGDIADRIADTLTIVAVAIVAVALVASIAAVMLGTAGVGGAAIFGLAGFAPTLMGYATTLFTAAAYSKLIGTGAKATSKALYHDPDLAWTNLVKDAALARLTIAGGPVKAARKLGETKAFGKAFWKVGEMAMSGSRVARFTIRSGEISGAAWSKYYKVRDAALGTSAKPTMAGMVDTIWRKGEKVWYKRKDDPLSIFTDPIQTSPGHAKAPDGVGVWVKDFGRSIFQV
jgi:uncharacterized protein YukE